MKRRTLLLATLAGLLAGCSSIWSVSYENGVSPASSKNWHVHHVRIALPSSLTVSEANVFAPDADIVWHGEPLGDRKKQVSQIMFEAVERAATGLKGPRPVRIVVQLNQFHAVTPRSVAVAPGAVHNIAYTIMVEDIRTGSRLAGPELINADLEAYVGGAAAVAATQGQTQRVRIIDHLVRVTRGWLGTGPDMRGTFRAPGR